MNKPIQAKPNMNGNAPKDFREAGIQINEIAYDVKPRVQQIIYELLNGRNYQHDQKLRQADNDRMRKIYASLDDLVKVAEEIFNAGDEKQ